MPDINLPNYKTKLQTGFLQIWLLQSVILLQTLCRKFCELPLPVVCNQKLRQCLSAQTVASKGGERDLVLITHLSRTVVHNQD